jgi:hypothetical protein
MRHITPGVRSWNKPVGERCEGFRISVIRTACSTLDGGGENMIFHAWNNVEHPCRLDLPPPACRE